MASNCGLTCERGLIDEWQPHVCMGEQIAQTYVPRVPLSAAEYNPSITPSIVRKAVCVASPINTLLGVSSV